MQGMDKHFGERFFNSAYGLQKLRFLKYFGQKKVFFGGQKHKSSVSRAKIALLHGILHIELNLENCNHAQKRRICGDNSKYAPDENL